MEHRLKAPVCDRGNDLIAFLYGEASERESQDFQGHLRNCAECQSELGSFKQVRESISAWRDESLGSPSVGRSSPVAGSLRRVEARKPSAISAIREFLSLSPLWLKGAIAFASILFCVAAGLAVARLFDESHAPAVANDEKLYTRQELTTKIEAAVKSKVQELEAQKEAREKEGISGGQAVADNNNMTPKRNNDFRRAAVANTSKSQRRPLTKSEREQLAADLRLTSSRDEMGLDLLGDRINQQQ